MTTGIEEEVRAVLEPAVRATQMDLGPITYERLRKAADAVYGLCADEENQARITLDLMAELEERLEDQ